VCEGVHTLTLWTAEAHLGEGGLVAASYGSAGQPRFHPCDFVRGDLRFTVKKPFR